jgi:flagellar hook-associated protein 1 FlgK
LNQSKEVREGLAGVNLDEEAANLIKFQQAYQASAQAISVSKSLFETLVGAIR